MDTREAARRWRSTWDDGWPRGDVDRIAALYAPTCQYRALAFRQPDEGAVGARHYLHANFTAEEGLTCSFNEPIVGESRAAVEWCMDRGGQGPDDGRRHTPLLRRRGLCSRPTGLRERRRWAP
jgi:SnoaL-like domain